MRFQKDGRQRPRRTEKTHGNREGAKPPGHVFEPRSQVENLRYDLSRQRRQTAGVRHLVRQFLCAAEAGRPLATRLQARGSRPSCRRRRSPCSRRWRRGQTRTDQGAADGRGAIDNRERSVASGTRTRVVGPYLTRLHPGERGAVRSPEARRGRRSASPAPSISISSGPKPYRLALSGPPPTSARGRSRRSQAKRKKNRSTWS